MVHKKPIDLIMIKRKKQPLASFKDKTEITGNN